jgi:transposase
MLQGEQNPQKLAELAQGRMKEKREQLAQALQGTLGDHHRFLLESQLRQLDFFTFQIREIDQEIAHRLGLHSDLDDPEPADSTGSLPAKEEPPDPPETPESSSPPCVQPDSPQPLSSAEAINILDEVPGMNVRVGAIVVAELGLEMERFPDEAHLASWVGLCPAAKISANKRLSTKTGKGNRWLRQALIEVANAAAREPRHLFGGVLPTTAQAHGA